MLVICSKNQPKIKEMATFYLKT